MTRYTVNTRGRVLPVQTREITCKDCGRPAVVQYVTNYPRRCAACAALRQDALVERTLMLEAKARTKLMAKASRKAKASPQPALVRYAGFDPTEHN